MKPKMLFAIALTVFTVQAHAAGPDFITVDKNEIQADLQAAFQAGSTEPLVFSKDGIDHGVMNQEEWMLLLTAQKGLAPKWHSIGEPDSYEIVIAKPDLSVPNQRTYKFTARYQSFLFKAPVCATLGLVINGEFEINQTSEGTGKQRTISIDSFTTSISDESQCV